MFKVGDKVTWKKARHRMKDPYPETIKALRQANGVGPFEITKVDSEFVTLKEGLRVNPWTLATVWETKYFRPAVKYPMTLHKFIKLCREVL